VKTLASDIERLAARPVAKRALQRMIDEGLKSIRIKLRDGRVITLRRCEV
jgi:hypothetical protein